LSNRPDNPGFLLTLVRVLIAQSSFPEAESELDRVEESLRRTGKADDPAWNEIRELRERLREGRSLSVR
jgi:hypothetical protein